MNQTLIVSFILLIVAAFIIYYLFKKCNNYCLQAHSQIFKNYPWLNDMHGGVNYVEFRKPGGDWKRYNDDSWKYHCSTLRHDSDNLVESHMKTFVNPATRTFELRFIFKDGTVEVAAEKHWIAERDWFAQNRLCNAFNPNSFLFW